MQLFIEHTAWQKIQYYVDTCKTEVSGIGKIERREGDFYVTDVKIFEQDVSGAHSDIDAETLAKFQVELLKSNEDPADWTLWWHSHANMGVFFSARDVDTIDESTDFRYMVSLVTNHKHELVARVDVYDPARLYTELDVDILLPDVSAEIATECQAEIDAKVRQKAITTKKVGFDAVKDVVGSRYHLNEYDDNDWWGNYYGNEYNPNLESYLAERDELEEQLSDAKKEKDETLVAIATEELNDCIRKGKRLGYER